LLNATVGVRRLLVRFRPVPTRRPRHRHVDTRRRSRDLGAGVTSRLVLASLARLRPAGASARLVAASLAAMSVRVGASTRRAISTRAGTAFRWAVSAGRDRAARTSALVAARFAIAVRRVSVRQASPRPLAGAHPIGRPESIVLRLRRSVIGAGRTLRLGIRAALGSAFVRDRTVPIGVAALVIAASLVNVAGSAGASGSTGNTGPAGSGPRIVIGGGANGGDAGSSTGGDAVGVGATGQSDNINDRLAGPEDPEAWIGPLGPFLDDGTLIMPVAVDTTVADGSDKLRSYRVRSGDTLTGIAHRFGVSMMSIWWANHLTSKDELKIGEVLVIPPVDGLVVTVAAGDTLDSIAQSTGVSADQIVSYNGLTDTNLVIGQRLIIPGARGTAIAKPKPAPRTSKPSRTTTYRPPAATYSGGAFAWPVPGGTISQYFHYGHPAIDIAAPYGSRVVAAAGGSVTFAGWNDNGGGYQIWISHGSGLYTTYNHLSAINVGVGERVGRAQQVGRVGQSGWATGPHLHFEVWRGYPWAGSSYRVNPLIYL
jgi:murein DD-endopeptidase MepM/ murein hydrolase activator NlpD